LSVGGYTDFSTSIHKRYFGKRAPVEVSLEITHRCPLKCLHCYNNLPMGDLNAATSELSLADYRKLIDEMAAAGVLWLLFTGGEVFARKDFLQIYQYAKEKGFLITIFTNGTLITPQVADFLAEWRPFAVEITLYGRTRETYEALTGHTGSFDRCMRGIELLLNRGVMLKLKTVPTRINAHEVYDMQRFAEELGVEFKFDPLVNPRTDCSQSPLAVRLSPEDVVNLEYQNPKRKADYRKLLETQLAKGPSPLTDQVYFCGGGMSSCAIDPYGNMSICVISHQDVHNVRELGFMHGWENFLKPVRDKKRTRLTKCNTCQIQSMCAMCPANGELENGDPESPVDFLCQVAHLRTMALDMDVPAHGDCECCPGGKYHEQLLVMNEHVSSAVPLTTLLSAQNLLPVLNQPPSSMGCGSCQAGGD
jgi:radical SAM protein with 4Fe4S-binding SPASM domain